MFNDYIFNVKAVTFSLDGRIIAAAVLGYCAVQLWDVATGAAVQMFKGHMSDIKGHTSDINAIAFSPDGRTVISASYDCTIKPGCFRAGDSGRQIALTGNFGY